MPQSTCSRFLKSRDGNFALMLGIASFPILGAVAMTIEYANLSSNQSRLQNATDAAALYVGKYFEEHGENPSNRDVRSFVVKNFDGQVTGVQVVGKGAKSDEFMVVAQSTAPDYFFGKMSPGVFKQEAEALVPKSSIGSMNIAMVLDRSASMRFDGKMDALKDTARQFIDDIAALDGGADSVRIGVVPFDAHVNVGLSKGSEPWVYEPAPVTRTENQCSSTRTGGTEICEDQTVVIDGHSTVERRCRWEGATYTQTCQDNTWTEYWRGCVGSRSAPYTFRDTAPNVAFEGLLNVWCGSEVKPLTSDWADLKSYVGGLVPDKDTYAAVGVMWGLRVLSPEVPYTEANSSPDAKRVMIVMADGDNTKTHNLSGGSARNSKSDGVQGDANMLDACREARSEGVEIFTIAFGTSITSRGQSVLRSCASATANYYLARDAKALGKAFNGILKQLNTLRLTG